MSSKVELDTSVMQDRDEQYTVGYSMEGYDVNLFESNEEVTIYNTGDLLDELYLTTDTIEYDENYDFQDILYTEQIEYKTSDEVNEDIGNNGVLTILLVFVQIVIIVILVYYLRRINVRNNSKNAKQRV